MLNMPSCAIPFPWESSGCKCDELRHVPVRCSVTHALLVVLGHRRIGGFDVGGMHATHASDPRSWQQISCLRYVQGLHFRRSSLHPVLIQSLDYRRVHHSLAPGGTLMCWPESRMTEQRLPEDCASELISKQGMHCCTQPAMRST